MAASQPIKDFVTHVLLTGNLNFNNEHIVLHLFIQIENDPALLAQYNAFINSNDPNSRQIVNSQISQAINELTYKRPVINNNQPVTCTLIQSYSRF